LGFGLTGGLLLISHSGRPFPFDPSFSPYWLFLGCRPTGVWPFTRDAYIFEPATWDSLFRCLFFFSSTAPDHGCTLITMLQHFVRRDRPVCGRGADIFPARAPFFFTATINSTCFARLSGVPIRVSYQLDPLPRRLKLPFAPPEAGGPLTALLKVRALNAAANFSPSATWRSFYGRFTSLSLCLRGGLIDVGSFPHHQARPGLFSLFDFFIRSFGCASPSPRLSVLRTCLNLGAEGLRRRLLVLTIWEVGLAFHFDPRSPLF